MAAYYTPEIEHKTTALIQRRFHVSEDRAQRLAVAALNGIESHGGNPNNWDTVVETVTVVVASWMQSEYLL